MLNHLLSFFISFGIIQGLIFIIIIRRIKDANKEANKILFYFICLIVLSLIGRLILVQNIIQDYPHAYLLIDILFFFHGPLLYLYVEKLTDSKPVFKHSIYHFSFAIIHIITMIPFILMSPQAYLDHIYNVGIWIYPYDWALALVHIAVYIFLSLKLIKNNDQLVELELSYDSKMNFLKTIIYTMAFFLIGWIHAFLVEVFNVYFLVELYKSNFFWLSFPLFSTFLGYFALSKPEIFREKKTNLKYELSKLSLEEMNEIKNKLEAKMRDEKPFLNSKLTINDLANSLDIHKKDLSRVINQNYHQNFFEFINSYRVKEFKELILMGKHKTFNLTSLALDAGFNSKTAFNTVFKRFTKLTPSEYIKKTSI